MYDTDLSRRDMSVESKTMCGVRLIICHLKMQYTLDVDRRRRSKVASRSKVSKAALKI